MEAVKSARRVFEFLEYFARVQRAVSVAEIAGHHGYPNSSVSAVMQTMVAMGYVSYDASARNYLPTARLPFVASWIGTRLYDSDSVRAIMRELSQATSETVVLGAQNGTRAQYIDIIDATGPVRLHATAGSFRSMPHTAVGLMLLGRLPDRELGALLRRINNEEPDPARHVDLVQTRDTVAQARLHGHALSLGGVVPGAGALAMLLPASLGVTPLAIGIASVEPVLVHNHDRFVAIMRQAIDRHTNHEGRDGLRREQP